MKNYYKICLLSPLWFPALLFLIYYIGERANNSFIDSLPGWLAMAGVFVVYSLIFGGVQYLATLSIVWFRIDFSDFRSWGKWILRIPFIFTPLQLLGLFLVSGLRTGRFMDFESVLGLLFFDLAFAYSYVAVWLVGYTAIRAVQNRRTREKVIYEQ